MSVWATSGGNSIFKKCIFLSILENPKIFVTFFCYIFDCEIIQTTKTKKKQSLIRNIRFVSIVVLIIAGGYLLSS